MFQNCACFINGYIVAKKKKNAIWNCSQSSSLHIWEFPSDNFEIEGRYVLGLSKKNLFKTDNLDGLDSKICSIQNFHFFTIFSLLCIGFQQNAFSTVLTFVRIAAPLFHIGQRN